MTNRIMVAAVFLAGCAVGGMSSQLVVPKASAQQAATLTKWEMRCAWGTNRADDGPESMTLTGTAFGREGWEPIYGVNDVMCFKRPKM